MRCIEAWNFRRLRVTLKVISMTCAAMSDTFLVIFEFSSSHFQVQIQIASRRTLESKQANQVSSRLKKTTLTIYAVVDNIGLTKL